MRAGPVDAGALDAGALDAGAVDAGALDAGAPGGGTGPGAAVSRFTVLYDADCPLCTWVRSWLEDRPQYVPLDFVPLGSPQARAAFPALDHDRTREEVTVVADTGEVWTADGAWLAVLWATVDYRSLAERLSGPQMRGQVRRVALSLAASRMGRPAPPPCGPSSAGCRVPTPAGGSAHAPAGPRLRADPRPGAVVSGSMTPAAGG